MVGIHFWMIFCIVKQFEWVSRQSSEDDPDSAVTTTDPNLPSPLQLQRQRQQRQTVRKVGQVFYVLMIIVMILNGCWYFQVCSDESDTAATLDQPAPSVPAENLANQKVEMIDDEGQCFDEEVVPELEDYSTSSTSSSKFAKNRETPKMQRINWRNWLSSIILFFWGLDLYWYSINHLHNNGALSASIKPVGSIRSISEKSENAVLVRDGIYAYCRHPAYFALLLQFMAMSLHTYRPIKNILPLLLLVVSFTYFIVFRIPEEERQLKETFGNSWISYKRSTTSNCCSSGCVGAIRGIISYFYHLFDPTIETFQPTQSVQSVQNSPIHKLSNSNISTADKIEHSESVDKLQS